MPRCMNGALLAAQHRIADWYRVLPCPRSAICASSSQATKIPAHKARHDAEQQAWLRERRQFQPGAPLHIEGGARLEGPAINPVNAEEAVPGNGVRTNRGVAVIDNLLSDEGLVYRCAGFAWARPYGVRGLTPAINAFPGYLYFSATLLAQIAEEFRLAYFPPYAAWHPLKYAWAFKV